MMGTGTQEKKTTISSFRFLLFGAAASAHFSVHCWALFYQRDSMFCSHEPAHLFFHHDGWDAWEKIVPKKFKNKYVEKNDTKVNVIIKNKCTQEQQRTARKKYVCGANLAEKMSEFICP